ncbi:MAG: sugar phosphate isomerase/epimerase [Chryseosolibacter sp.]
MNMLKAFPLALLIGACTLLTSCKKNDGPPTGDSPSPTVEYPETALGWKLGAQAYTFRLFSFFEAIDKIDSCGLKYVEAYSGQVLGGGLEGKMDYKMEPAKREKILEKLRQKGVSLVAYGVENPGNEADWRQLFEFGKAMGIQTFTSEPKEEFLPLISKLCEEYDIQVAIHNHPEPRHYWKPEMVLAALEGQSKKLGACADVGHWVRSGLDPVECLKKLEGHILHLHMKDLNHKEGKDEGADDRDVPWGTGVANTDGVIEELKRQNFKGIISAEYERNWEHNVPEVTASVAYFRNALRQ